jgi:hypothetical protein
MSFINAKTGASGETVFANYLPLDMIREILKSNRFYTREEVLELEDNDESSGAGSDL